ncbi:MAG: ATP-binding cassette domain-containing protein [Gammaproteobacteria bacterium]|nr:ATP-binding cassette domain-containing protein [Gammaproteobacteria bacterium]
MLTLNKEALQGRVAFSAIGSCSHEQEILFQRLATAKLITNSVPVLVVIVFLSVKIIAKSEASPSGVLTISDLNDILLVLTYIFPYFSQLSLTLTSMNEVYQYKIILKNLNNAIREYLDRFASNELSPKDVRNSTNTQYVDQLFSEDDRSLLMHFKANEFAYKLKPQSIVLHDATLDVSPGKIYTSVGFSGAGKSTIFNILLGLSKIHPDFKQKLTITLNGLDFFALQDNSPSLLTDYVGYLPQHVQIFHDKSLRYNVCYGDPGISDDQFQVLEEIELISRALQIYNDITVYFANPNNDAVVKLKCLEMASYQNSPLNCTRTSNSHNEQEATEFRSNKIKKLYDKLFLQQGELRKSCADRTTEVSVYKSSIKGMLITVKKLMFFLDLYFERSQRLVEKEETKEYIQMVRADLLRLLYYYEHLSEQKVETYRTRKANLETDFRPYHEKFLEAVKSAELTSLSDKLGLTSPIGQEVSGGERQRIGIARLFMKENARLYLLDEPTAALDAYVAYKVVDTFIKMLSNRKGCAAVVITHNMMVAKMLSETTQGSIFVFGKDLYQAPGMEKKPVGTIIEEGLHSYLGGELDDDLGGAFRDGVYRDLFWYYAGYEPSDKGERIEAYRDGKPVRAASWLDKKTLPQILSMKGNPTIGDGNCFFHACLGSPNSKGVYQYADAAKVREHWYNVLTKFKSLNDNNMPLVLKDCLEKMFSIYLDDPSKMPQLNVSSVIQLRTKTISELEKASSLISSEIDLMYDGIATLDKAYQPLFCTMMKDFYDSPGLTKDKKHFAEIIAIRELLSSNPGPKDFWAKRNEILNILNEVCIRDKLFELAPKYIGLIKQTASTEMYDVQAIRNKFFHNIIVFDIYAKAVLEPSYFVFLDEVNLFSSMFGLQITVRYNDSKTGNLAELKLEPSNNLPVEFRFKHNLSRVSVCIELVGQHFQHVSDVVAKTPSAQPTATSGAVPLGNSMFAFTAAPGGQSNAAKSPRASPRPTKFNLPTSVPPKSPEKDPSGQSGSNNLRLSK